MPANPRRRLSPGYLLHKPSGQARVRIDGRDHYLGAHGSPESLERYHQLLASRSRQAVEWPTAEKERSSVTITEIAASFFQHAETYYRRTDGTATHEVNNIRQALRVLREIYGTNLAEEFGPLKLQSVRQAMIDRGWSRGNINRSIRRVVLCFQWACQQELIRPELHHGLKSVRGLQKGRSAARESDEVKPVAQADVDAVLSLVRPQVAAIIRLQLLTGARPGELLEMRGVDLDQAGVVWIFRPQQHKNAWRGHTREIFLGPQAQKILGPFMKPDSNVYLFSPAEAEAARDAQRSANCRSRSAKRVRKSNPKRSPRDRYSVHSYARAVSRACAKAGVQHWHPHQLRHSAATEYKRLFGVEVARVLLGHRSVAMTEHYAETDARRAVEILAKFG